MVVVVMGHKKNLLIIINTNIYTEHHSEHIYRWRWRLQTYTHTHTHLKNLTTDTFEHNHTWITENETKKNYYRQSCIAIADRYGKQTNKQKNLPWLTYCRFFIVLCCWLLLSYLFIHFYLSLIFLSVSYYNCCCCCWAGATFSSCY